MKLLSIIVPKQLNINGYITVICEIVIIEWQKNLLPITAAPSCVNVITYPTWLHTWFTGDYLHLSGIRFYDADWIPTAMCKTIVSDWLVDTMTIEHKTKLPYFRSYICVSQIGRAEQYDHHLGALEWINLYNKCIHTYLCFYKISDIKARYRTTWGFDVRHQGKHIIKLNQGNVQNKTKSYLTT